MTFHLARRRSRLSVPHGANFLYYVVYFWQIKFVVVVVVVDIGFRRSSSSSSCMYHVLCAHCQVVCY